MCSCCGDDGLYGSDSDFTNLDTDTDSLEDSSQCSEYSSLSEAPREDGAGDYSGETYNKHSATKRARTDKGTNAGTAPAKKGSGRRKKTLCLIVTMPIDILLEIFSLLEPVDLLYLFRTNKAFHKVLSANNAVWKAARANRGGVPDCIPGMSEAEWANLLFGHDDSHCQECGKKGIWPMDFGIRRRVCPLCIKENLVCVENFPNEFPEYDPIIMDLVPSTDNGGDDHEHLSSCTFFLTRDVVDMAKELKAYLKPGAEQALEDFKQSRKKYVSLDVKHAAVCSTWSDNDDSRRRARALDFRDQNTLLFQARLVDLGHDAQDVKRMFDRHHYGILDKGLTDARWKRLIPKIERKLAELQEEWRLQKQSAASNRRSSRLLDMYKKYAQPFPQATIPPPYDFLKLRDVTEFIKSPPTGDKESDIQLCSAFEERILEFCAEYTHKLKLEVTRLLTLSTDVVQGTTALQCQGIDAPDDMLMQLATSVFQCTSGSFPLITWDKLQYHRCSVRSESWDTGYGILMSTSFCTFSISERGVAAARSLLSLVGLDAQTTTASTMDNIQCRFFCSNCPPRLENGGSYRFVMNWRQGVFHYFEKRDQSHTEPRWESLSAAQLQVVQSWRAPEYPGGTRQVWRCNKCEAYYSNPTTRVTVIAHCKNSHGVTTPAEGIDFSYDQSVIERPPPPTKYFVTPQTEKPSTVHKTQKSKRSTKSTYRCQHCNGLNRTFILEGVKAHIKTKHNINSPSEGTDFCNNDSIAL
ncbi:hypothetical protein EDD22DRAFT_1052963 [Suillus occidentalis]|nr:hypothetical protein EDD22DRAFT_1052963 [Suillus occidentalis]